MIQERKKFQEEMFQIHVKFTHRIPYNYSYLGCKSFEIKCRFITQKIMTVKNYYKFKKYSSEIHRFFVNITYFDN